MQFVAFHANTHSYLLNKIPAIAVSRSWLRIGAVVNKCSYLAKFIRLTMGWALVAPSYFALQVPDGRHVLPFLAKISTTQRNT